MHILQVWFRGKRTRASFSLVFRNLKTPPPSTKNLCCCSRASTRVGLLCVCKDILCCCTFVCMCVCARRSVCEDGKRLDAKNACRRRTEREREKVSVRARPIAKLFFARNRCPPSKKKKKVREIFRAGTLAHFRTLNMRAPAQNKNNL